MKSWTRTLNLDDAHTLLAVAEPGTRVDDWSDICHGLLPELSVARRRELIRILRDGFLDIGADGRIVSGLFLEQYRDAPAVAQIDLVQIQWALSHPLTLVAVEELVAPALECGEPDIPLDDVEALVEEKLVTSSLESRRKTRTVLLGALEGVGVLVTRGTGQHRTLRASRGAPHPLAFGYLVMRDLAERRLDAMIASEVTESSLPVRLTQCGFGWAEHCLRWNLETGLLTQRDDEIGLPQPRR
ncbi:MAG TPA: hypothetical protein PKA64_00375 [Myxococcota bacterium]|nr:hypothetical protein [Myxococcota bacterium]